MKAEFIRCPHCGLLHPGVARSCPATGAAIQQAPPDADAPAGAPGAASGQAARLVVQTAEGERTFYLRPMNSLGRHPNNSIQILDKIVSKEHCRIEREDERFILRDLGSLNGTYINGERVHGVSPLNHGDMITLGATRAFFYEPRVAEAPTAIEEESARFLAHLALDKPVYRPGETLFARAAVLEADLRAPLLRAITLAFEVRSPRGEIVVNRAGQVTAGVAPFSWSIPADLAGGDYMLHCLFPADGFPSAEIIFSVDDGAKAIREEGTPAASEVTSVHLSLYPEGGDLVVGLATRLYFEARTPQGKPAEVAGRIVDGAGEVVARFRTEHEGRGLIAFTPARAGRAYMAVLDEPSGVTDLFPLPEVITDGIVISSLDDETAPEEGVRLRVATSSEIRARVVLYRREREVAAVRVDLAAGEAREVALTPPGTIDGVLRATVYDLAGLPRAERLVFRKPRRSLRIAIDAAPAEAGLRARASVQLRTTTADGKPTPAIIMVSVVDDAVLETIARRERHPRLPVQALLGSEVRDLSDPEAYLSNDATSAKRLDLLLGVQGWRRFAFHDVSRFIAEHGDRGDRAMARRRPVAPALAMIMPGPPRGVVMMMAAGAPMAEPNAPTAPRAPIVAAPKAAPKAEAPLPPPRARIGPLPRRPSEANPAAARPAALAIVREYAHQAPPFEGTRTLFPDTLYWNAGLPTRETGEVTIAFDLCDTVTTFRVRADAFGADGALGQGDATIATAER